MYNVLMPLNKVRAQFFFFQLKIDIAIGSFHQLRSSSLLISYTYAKSASTRQYDLYEKQGN